MSDLPPRMAAWIRDVEERSGIRDIFWRGNPLYAIREEFAPQEGDLVVHKKTFGAFNSSNLDDVLREHGIDTLVICGISTNCCVETTARDAADRGYGVVIVDEALRRLRRGRPRRQPARLPLQLRPRRSGTADDVLEGRGRLAPPCIAAAAYRGDMHAATSHGPSSRPRAATTIAPTGRPSTWNRREWRASAGPPCSRPWERHERRPAGLDAASADLRGRLADREGGRRGGRA